jgi:hypothetical protein
MVASTTLWLKYYLKTWLTFKKLEKTMRQDKVFLVSSLLYGSKVQIAAGRDREALLVTYSYWTFCEPLAVIGSY